MSRSRPVVVLNDLQIGTLDALRSRANKSNIVSPAIVADYKRNVINALINREALVLHKNGYRLPAITVERKPDVVHRATKVSNKGTPVAALAQA